MVLGEADDTCSQETLRLRRQLSLYEAALGRMSHGLLMFDEQHRVTLFNRRFLDMFGLSPDAVHVGMPVRHLMAHNDEVGNFSQTSAEELWEAILARKAASEPFNTSLLLPSARVIGAHCEPLEDGGLVCVFTDVTEQQKLEKALRVQSERTHQAVGLMSHGICMYDADERLIMANEEYCRIYGLDPAVVKPGASLREAVEHASARAVAPHLDTARVYAERRAYARRGEPTTRQWRLTNGRIVNTVLRPTSDGGWVSYHEDVTARLAYEDALREQNLRFDAALNNMSHGLCMFDGEQRLIVCNEQYHRLYGLDPSVVRPGISYRAMLEHWRTCENAPTLSPDELYARRIANLGRKGPIETLIPLRNGRVIKATMRATPNGGWVSASEDVTERLSSEERLREQNLRFDAALENMAQGLIMLDADLRVLVCNRQYLELWGFDPEVVKPGISMMDVIRHSIERGNHHPGADQQTLFAQFGRKLRKRTGFIVRRLRDDHPIAISIAPMSGGGWVVTYEDVIAREHAAEKLSQQNLRFDAALNNMSHGLAMFDSEHRLIVCNEKYLTVFGSDPAIVKPGATIREIIAHRVETCLYSDMSVEDVVARRLAAFATGKSAAYDQPLNNGRTIHIVVRPMADGGWVATYEDVTEARRLERERAAALSDLREQHERFDAAISNMSHGLCMMGADHRLIVCNQRFREMLSLSPDVAKPGATLAELIGHSVEVGNRPGMTAEQARECYLSELKPGMNSVQRVMPDGRTLLVTRRLMDNGGWVAIYEDITAREQSAAALLEQNRRFDAALTHMPHGLCMLDDDLRLIVCNRRYLDLFGLSPEAVKPGISVRELLACSAVLGNHPFWDEEHFRSYREQLKAGRHTMHRHLTDGRTLLVEHSPNPHGGWVVTFEDITERLAAEARISHMATHDALTGLPNRVLFRDRMDRGLRRVEDEGGSMAVLCLDLDNFKSVNDTLGHPVGDNLLTTVARRITCVLGPDELFARLGGDEFAVLQRGPQPATAMALARRIIDVVSQPVFLDGNEINTGVSIGIAVAPNDGGAGDDLMKCADLALYRAKADGRSRFRLFEPDMDTRIQEKRALELDLRKALAAGEFELHYQPQMRASDCEITGMEALLRWNHAERGPVPPSEFIPLAEETGLIIPLGEWVLRRACAEAATWPCDIRLAVNLSPAQFKGRALVGMVTSALASAGLSPSRLDLEITEAVLLQEDDATFAMLHQLRALGVRISMDDFGTGYSSLSYLRSFPFDKIKIDRSFIADLDRGRDSAAIIRAVAGMGASLNIDTTAEGVETAEQFERVRRDGCTEIQGYYVSPPRPAAEVLQLVDRWRDRRGVA